MFKFELGQVVKDKITGYQGIVMVRAEYSTGCTHYGVLSQELDKNGSERPWNWLDESRWEAVEAPRIEKPSKKSSGPCPCGPNA